MTVMLITAWRAAETLTAFHRQRAADTAGEARAYHADMASRCAEDAECMTREIIASGVMPEHQATVIRSRDLVTAQRIIDRHPIMHGVGMPVEEVAPARVAMASDIADALAAERGGPPHSIERPSQDDNVQTSLC
jgi:hypothetical protein